MGWGSKERKLLAILALALSGGLASISGATLPENRASPPVLKADPNRAPAEVLGALPGLGPALAGRIVEARERSPFRSMDDLDRRVKGIGPAKAAAIRPFLRFDAGPVPSY